MVTCVHVYTGAVYICFVALSMYMEYLFVLCYLLCCCSATDDCSGGDRARVLVLYSSLQYDLRKEGADSIPCNLELLYCDLNTSNCQEQETKAVASFIQEVFMNGTNGDSVVATIGPSCTDSAYAISRLASRREVSIVHLHTSPLPAPLALSLNSSFGLLAPVELLADASIALIQHTGWSQVIALYQDTDTEMNFMFNHLRRQLVLNETLAYTSILYGGHIPLKFALSHFAIRVIFLMLGRDLARKAMCEAYHLGAVYPEYQWVILRTTLEDLTSEEELIYTDNGGMCKREELLVVLDQAILLGYESSKNTSQNESENESASAGDVYYHAISVFIQGFRSQIDIE